MHSLLRLPLKQLYAQLQLYVHPKDSHAAITPHNNGGPPKEDPLKAPSGAPLKGPLECASPSRAPLKGPLWGPPLRGPLGVFLEGPLKGAPR